MSTSLTEDHRRYWVLFWIAVGMAAHSLLVGRLLGSTFFMLVFFWGWVAAAAYRGRLEAAQSMTIVMVVILVGAAVGMAVVPSDFHNELAYYTFAFYPSLVSWVCVFFYIRHLQQRREVGSHSYQHPASRERSTA